MHFCAGLYDGHSHPLKFFPPLPYLYTHVSQTLSRNRHLKRVSKSHAQEVCSGPLSLGIIATYSRATGKPMYQRLPKVLESIKSLDQVYPSVSFTYLTKKRYFAFHSLMSMDLEHG